MGTSEYNTSTEGSGSLGVSPDVAAPPHRPPLVHTPINLGVGVGGGVAVHRSGSAGVERQVLRVILIPMDSAPQSQGRQPQKKRIALPPLCRGFLRYVNY